MRMERSTAWHTVVQSSTMRPPDMLSTLIFPLFALDLVSSLTLNVGVIMVHNNSYVGYETSASAILIAQDRIRSEGVLPGIDFNFIIRFDECREGDAAGNTIELVMQYNVSAIIGPSCNLPSVTVGALANYYDVPFFPWGLASTRSLEEEDRFPTAGTLAPGSYALGVAIRRLMLQFGWSEFAFIYSTVGDTEKCDTMVEDVEESISDFDDDLAVISFIYEFDEGDWSIDSLKEQMIEIRYRARIFAVCLSDERGLKRDFMLALMDVGMLTDEYLYIFADTRSRGFVTTTDGITRDIWEDVDIPIDGRDEDARVAFRSAFVLTDVLSSLTGAGSDNLTEFGEEVINRMDDAPFYCTTECNSPLFKIPSVYAGQLHDAVYLYALALNRTMTGDPEGYKDGRKVVDNAVVSFTGMSGAVKINLNGTRIPDFYLLAIDQASDTQVLATITVDGVDSTFNSQYVSEASVWWNRNGVRPLSIPICGLEGKSCPLSWTQNYLAIVIVGAVLLFLIIVGLIGGGAFLYRSKRREEERLNQMWQIPFNLLSKQKSQKGSESSRSLQSGPSSTSTKFTQDSKKDSVNYAFYIYNKETVVAAKYTVRVRVDYVHMVEMRLLRQLEHDNLNRFIGLTMDGPQFMSIWRYCSRGSLKDVLTKGTITLDSFFVFSLLRDIANGLSYIHHSFLKQHGALSSEVCLVDDRWQVKISYYGLSWIRSQQKRRRRDLLWTAPEHLRSEDRDGSPEGDVYSFAIVCSEVITKNTVWDLDNRKERPEEILYMLKKGGSNPIRPFLTMGENQDINPAMLHLIRDCWSENPADRPKIETVKSLLKSMHSGRSDNLMDHVFTMLENYAGSLEEEVETRTRELVEEKKKSDILLYRMLPRQVAEKLKLGQSVEPESFESVTIFFSDVVKFTNLAAKCTPLQVVNLLNDLYTIFDNIIDEHEVYKVETIGDGYLCVSGLPHRNGTEHIKDIADMSLAFMNSLITFRVPHLPNERINLRIGIHTGPCVAGVVGLTMPRYCLFGDTVNTASRMESNGKPGHIHLSLEANRLLTSKYPNYKTESRGEVIIKGKGVMETFWLVGTRDGTTISDTSRSATPKRETISPRLD